MTNVSNNEQTETFESLQKAYCPPLDEALFFAIASDHDFTNHSSVTELKAVLDSLKEGAVIEQELELLPEDEIRNRTSTPSPTKDGNGANITQNSKSSGPSQRDPLSDTDGDGVTSITTGISGLTHSEDGSEEYHHDTLGYGEAGEAMENLSEDKKIEWLGNMFPTVSVESIKEALAKSGGRFDQTTDELLNISFLNETGQQNPVTDHQVIRGIDAFMDNERPSQARRKGKARNRRKDNHTDHDGSASPWMSDSASERSNVAPSNRWTGATRDIDFVASRTHLKRKLITSVFHANNAQVAPTIRAFVTQEGEPYLRTPDAVEDVMHWQIEELKDDFPHVPNSQIYGTLMLTNKNPGTAKELLEVMTTNKEEPVMLGKVKGLASYTPIDLSEDEDINVKSHSPLLTATPVGPGLYTTSHLANTHGLAASQAFQQASAAYKRGKSDHLMGGAAAYYASVGHERSKAAKALQASAANAHVARQSSSTVLDLHGVSVADAVRIARQGAESWWDGLGDRKYVPVGGIGSGYRIVTGVGRHSSDGIGRIGPAVSKMLVREGWKVQVESGELVVLGKTRKR